jgi:GT2 family glycosyltransferase
MDSFEKNVTVIIVTFKSNHIIERCIKNIKPNVKIIIVENSDNVNVKNYLENKFSNVKVFIAKENLGYGRGNNLGISKVNTQYAFILNPDVVLEDNCLLELYKAKLLLKDDFTILAPNLLNNYGFFSDQNNDLQQEIMEVDYVKGFAMLINLKKINFQKIFDENFFLFLEEIDLCKRIRDNGGKIFVIKNSKVQHLGKQSSGDSLNIKLCRNWHWMWSLHYYNSKNFGSLVAYKITLYKFISSIIKMIIAILFLKKEKYLIHRYRLLGLINAYKKKKSWLRLS